MEEHDHGLDTSHIREICIGMEINGYLPSQL